MPHHLHWRKKGELRNRLTLVTGYQNQQGMIGRIKSDSLNLAVAACCHYLSRYDISTDYRPGRDVVPKSKLTPGGFDGKSLDKISIFQGRFRLHLT